MSNATPLYHAYTCTLHEPLSITTSEQINPWNLEIREQSEPIRAKDKITHECSLKKQSIILPPNHWGEKFETASTHPLSRTSHNPPKINHTKKTQSRSEIKARTKRNRVRQAGAGGTARTASGGSGDPRRSLSACARARPEERRAGLEWKPRLFQY